MERFRKIADLQDVTEMLALKAMLEELDIPHVLKGYEDTVYAKFFKPHKGWGHIEAADEHEAEIMKLLNQLRTAEEPGP